MIQTAAFTDEEGKRQLLDAAGRIGQLATEQPDPTEPAQPADPSQPAPDPVPAKAGTDPHPGSLEAFVDFFGAPRPSPR